MKLLTGISITCLVLTIAALVFVLGLYEEIENLKTEDPKLRDKPAKMLPPKVQSNKCQVLSHHLASSMTEKASQYFGGAWGEAGCDEEFESDELVLDIERKANLVRTQVDELLSSYSQSSVRHKDCLWHRETWQSRNYLNPRITTYEPTEERWLINITGNSCKGIESFSVNDVNGEVSYLGSSLDK